MSVLANQLQKLVVNTNFNHIVLTNLQGEEIIAVMRNSTTSQYILATDVDWNPEVLFEQFSVSEDIFDVTGFLQADNNTLFYIAVPILEDNNRVGYAFMGQSINHVIVSLSVSNLSPVVLFDSEGNVLQSGSENIIEQSDFDSIN